MYLCFMIHLQIPHIDIETHKLKGVYPLLSNQLSLNLNNFQKAYVYGILKKNQKRGLSFFFLGEQKQSTSTHLQLLK